MVSTGKPKAQTTNPPTKTPTTGAGMRGVKYRTKNIKISVPRAMAKVAKCKSPISEKYKAHFEMKSGGTCSKDKPKKSPIWEEKIVRAIPAVKPVVTGYGIYLIMEPSLKKPARASMQPAMKEVMTSPS